MNQIFDLNQAERIWALMGNITTNLNHFSKNPLTISTYCLFFAHNKFLLAVMVFLYPKNIISLWCGKHITPELLVGYYNIHPFFLYAAFILCGFKFLGAQLATPPHKLAFYLCLYALVLGASWGWGNAVWGFFWVNDVIEWALLLLTLCTLVCMHVYKYTRLKKLLILSFMLFCCLLFMLRCGLLFSRHSFFSGAGIKNVLLVGSQANGAGVLLLFLKPENISWIFSLGVSIFAVYSVLNVELQHKKYLHQSLLSICTLWVATVPNNQTLINFRKLVKSEDLYKTGGNWITESFFLLPTKIKNYSLHFKGVFNVRSNANIEIITSYPHALCASLIL